MVMAKADEVVSWGFSDGSSDGIEMVDGYQPVVESEFNIFPVEFKMIKGPGNFTDTKSIPILLPKTI